jgi:hypothetical protein
VSGFGLARTTIAVRFLRLKRVRIDGRDVARPIIDLPQGVHASPGYLRERGRP